MNWKKIITALFCTIPTFSMAQTEQDSTRSADTAESLKPITQKDFCKQLFFATEIIITDISGERVIDQMGETREYPVSAPKPDGNCTSQSGFSAGSSDFIKKDIIMSFHAKVTPDNTVSMKIEEYKSIEFSKSRESPNYKGLLKEENITFKNFAPVVWESVSAGNEKYKAIVRITPKLKDLPTTKDAKDSVLGGKNLMVYDQAGNIWTNNLTIGAKYVGLKTHKGTVLFSFYPFKGAEKIGEAEGRKIVLRKNTTTLHIVSESDFLPPNQSLNVYAKIDLNMKSPRITSMQSSSSSSEENFLKRVSAW